MKREWTKEQQDAIDARGGNLLVSASAGSGKTAILVERIVKKVISEGLDVDKILVVTFTNAAACELKERLQKAIFEALKNDKTNMHLRRQLNNINRASITTIHSFCLDVIHSNFYKIGIDPNFGICDDTKAKLMMSSALSYVLEEEYKEYNESQFGLYDVLSLFNMNEEDFLASILKILTEINCYISPFEWLNEKVEKYNITDASADLYSFDFGKNIYEDVMSSLKLLCSKCEDMRRNLAGAGDEFLKHVELIDDDIQDIKRCIECSCDRWDRLFSNLNMIDMSRRMPSKKVLDEKLKEKFACFRKDVIKPEIAKAKSYIYDKSENINKELRNMYPYLAYIMNFAKKVDKQYFKLKNDQNVIDFNDIEHMALDILLEKDENGLYVPTKEAIKYKEKFEEIYIDEYQDTSYIQEYILNSVSNENIGNKFMVGDIKQSIYRFRHASPSIFLEKYMSYKNYSYREQKEDSKIILAKNFRSRKEVIDGINYIFEQIMSLDMGDCNYSGEEVLTLGNMDYRAESGNYKFEINIIDTKDNGDIGAEYSEALEYINELKNIEKEAMYVADRINRLVNKEKLQVMDGKSLRDIKYSDICILFRNQKSKSEAYEKALKQANIPVYNSKQLNLWDNDEVRLILSFLKVLDNPFQEIELISVMYSVLGMFTLDEIYEIKSRGFKVNIYDILKDWDFDEKEHIYGINNKIRNFMNVLSEYMGYVKVLNVADILTRLYKNTKLYNYVLFLENPAIRKMNLDSLIQISSNEKNAFNVSEFISYIEALKDKMIDSPDISSTSSENENVVKLMTIHKSKGLEFPVVILANMSGKYVSKELSDKILLNSKYGVGIDCINSEFGVTYPSVIKEAIKHQITKEMKSEELRMLYVALTRAREKIITYSLVKDLDKKLDKIYVLKNDDGRVESIVSQSCNSYTDLLLLAIKDIISDKENKYFDINYLVIKDNLENIDWKNKLSRSVQSIIKEKRDDLKVLDANKIESIEKALSKDLILNYKYKEECLVKRRVGVSSLKEELNPYKNKLLSSGMFNMPSCLQSEKDNITGSRRGTLIHYVLQNIDYLKVTDANSMDKYLDKLLNEKVITEKEYNVLDKEALNKYIISNVANEVRKSKYYKKEVEFVLKNSSFSKSMIQGVVDLYYEDNNSKINIIDFKTDNITDEDEFIKRYGLQLEVYKEALHNITKKEIASVYIYSFKLGKEILVK